MTPDSTSAPELSLIVPTYNESENITALVERVHSALSGYSYEIIVVDDNSPDGTADLAKSLSNKYPVKVVVRTRERGLATAVVAGFAEATGQLLGVIDADLQHPPEMIPTLLQAARDGADVVIASRYVPGGGTEDWNWFREFMSRGAKLPAILLLPSLRGVKDPLSGFFLFRKRIIEGITLAPIGYKILLEVLIRGKAGKVVEVPFTFKGREHGQSNLTFKEQVNYLAHLGRLAWLEGDAQRFLKFCVVGTIGFGTNMGSFWLLTRIADLYDLAAIPIALEISIIGNFILNEFWTFRDKRTGGGKDALVRALKFNLISAGATAIYYAIYTPLTRFAGVHDLIAYPIAIFVGLIWNFSLNFMWTWKVRARS